MSIETAAVRGVAVHYGPRTTTGKYGRAGNDTGLVKTAEWTFDFDDLPAGSTDSLGVSIPAYAKIVSASLEILVGFTSTSTTTDLLIGLETAAGGTIDADGLVAAAEATQAAILTRGLNVVGAGSLVGAGVGSAAGKLVVAPSVADLLTGKGRVTVEYTVEKVGN
jgi:hypothetical protein